MPPPTALKTRNPWRLVQLSASFMKQFRHKSTISLPTEVGQPGKNAKLGQDVHSMPDSPMLETMLSFGSTSSLPLLVNLRPIWVHVEDGGGGGGVRVADQKLFPFFFFFLISGGSETWY